MHMYKEKHVYSRMIYHLTAIQR